MSRLSERSIRIKKLISTEVSMGTFGLVELELKEFDRIINELQEREELLLALEGAGVDNWSGYSDAIESIEG